MADAGNPDSRISLFFDAPTQNDTISGVALSGYAGQHWLKTFGLQPDDFSSSHLIRCYGPGTVAMPLLYDSARHCRRHDRADNLPTTSVYTLSLSQGLAVPAYRRLIQLDVQKARRLAARNYHVAVRFGRACFQFDCPQEWAIDSDMRRWRGHVRSANVPFGDWFPPCHRNESALRALLRDTTGPIGLDLEYQPDLTPTILGLAFYDNGNLVCGATGWNPYLAADVVDSGRQLVAYSAFEADAGVLSGALSVSIPSTRWIDALQLHWMNNRDLMDVPRDEDQGTSLQLMGLWTAASIVLDVPNWKRCLRASTKVVLADGKRVRIASLDQNRWRGKSVISVDRFGKRKTSPITGFFKSERGNRKMFSISYEGNPRPRSTSIVTEDHEVLSEYGWIRADKLKDGMPICTGAIGLTINQKSVLSGVVLGDGHIDRGGRLHLFHSRQQWPYLESKVAFLSTLGLSGPTIRRHSGWSDFAHYKSKRQPVLYGFNVWRYFNEASLAILCLDDGYLSKDRRFEIAVTSWDETSVDVLVEKISSMGISCSKRKSKSMKGYRIDFSVVETMALCLKIARYVHPCMRYKLVDGGKFLDQYDHDFFLPPPERIPSHYAPAIVKEVAGLDRYVYCLSVDGDESFITPSVAVHNCRGLACEGRFCRAHDALGYCAMDAAAGLAIWKHYQ